MNQYSLPRYKVFRYRAIPVTAAIWVLAFWASAWLRIDALEEGASHGNGLDRKAIPGAERFSLIFFLVIAAFALYLYLDGRMRLRDISADKQVYGEPVEGYGIEQVAKQLGRRRVGFWLLIWLAPPILWIVLRMLF
ncbi:hypothetical protein [Nocardia huaxiensis]|uniref:hypothetical protein n=1 Tax=Nocardia huaxiensis TaxID=2755382 RepID=UPI001E59FA89|nr:hypothetical protein [Nocardia huaxiensis]UFS96635.1 hypothetical protein LPY97_01465 [Nocardia huaxiensis]